MYWTLGIIARDDMISGNFRPSYVLCKQKDGLSNSCMKRCDLVTPHNIKLYKDRNDSEALIEYYGAYRPKSWDETEQKYISIIPEGGLFWFECNRFGELTDQNIFIMRVPVSRSRVLFENRKRKMEESLKSLTISQIAKRDIYCLELKTSDVKRKFVQKPKYRNGGKKENG